MRYATALVALAATAASAFVLPDDAMVAQMHLHSDDAKPTTSSSSSSSSPASWLERLQPALHDARAAAEEMLTSGLEAAATALGVEVVTEDAYADFLPAEAYLAPSSVNDKDAAAASANGHVGRPGHHDTTNLTVYQAIKASNFTRRFAAVLDEHPVLVKKLNATGKDAGNVTVFVPLDKAFDKLPHHGDDEDHKPPKEIVEKILAYHVLESAYPAGRVLAHSTLPTALESPALGGRPQRLRVSLSLFGLRLNFYSKVVMVNLFCKNGVAHGVDSILVPPPPSGRLIALFPGRFSTLLLAVEKTGLHSHMHDLLADASLSSDNDKDSSRKKKHHHDDHDHDPLTGLTTFAPTNLAFRRLGPAANAFLFNTEKGLGYLRALLKYHVVANETLYTDAYYGLQKKSRDSADERRDLVSTGIGNRRGRYHVDLPTLLHGRRLAVDISRWHGFVSMVVNGRTRVATADAVARDGVVHVVNSVLVPARRHPPPPGDGDDDDDDEYEEKVERDWEPENDDEEDDDEAGWISVEDLMERLAPYVDEGEEEMVKGEKKHEELGGSAWGEL
ncbi:FAS1 domain-containing protein [Xylariaceae sp. FL0804]|nr:FAS1 domain-containing protein [Xylariaceae sp. FL0804]